ncbi:hypothetical protein HELRODRAFT_178017 [Helobdella robusta]|uniref:DUF753 domain-containing protein n=1 Tax=Helobdella robusta TaxID=6412 RepID=T1FCM2_HELRO|nr:hypothetical protein HELRODRAFT_178017 [Helobdella robusta]ESN97582.1 hypothetical protein HELRODRAFT_178017 [Helobdella robusta]
MRLAGIFTILKDKGLSNKDITGVKKFETLCANGRSDEVLLVIVVAALLTRWQVEAVRCFKCDSDSNPSCGLPFNKEYVDTCTGKFCWKEENWNGGVLPLPPNMKVTATRTCLNDSKSSSWINYGDFSIYADTCDEDFCNGPIMTLSENPKHNKSMIDCYYCSGKDCNEPVNSMKQCRGYSCYVEVSLSQVTMRTCLSAFSEASAEKVSINGIKISVLTCNENLCNAEKPVEVQTRLQTLFRRMFSTD